MPYQDAFWTTTVERWRAEGLPADSSPDDYFGCEIARIAGDYTLQLPVEAIEETARYRIYRDANGATRKEISEGDDWTPHYLAYSIESRQDWQRLKGRAAYNESRLPPSCLAAYQRARQRERFVAFSAHACFHPTWQKIGMERLFCAMLEDPDWIADMFSAHTDLIIGLYEGMGARDMEFDGAFIADDLGYREAPMISPHLYRDLVQPQHRRLCERFARDGLRTILHSDGNVMPLVGDFLEAGFTALHPLEAKAGLDVGRLRQQIGAVFTSRTMVRFRSSSNVEDALEFNGAGLYESTSACALDLEEDAIEDSSFCDPNRDNERTIPRALKKVWTSLWAFRAFEERAFYGIPQDTAAMGLLVNRAFPDELVNGVAFTGSPTNPFDPRYVVIAQLEEVPVVSPPTTT